MSDHLNELLSKRSKLRCELTTLEQQAFEANSNLSYVTNRLGELQDQINRFVLGNDTAEALKRVKLAEVKSGQKE